MHIHLKNQPDNNITNPTIISIVDIMAARHQKILRTKPQLASKNGSLILAATARERLICQK